MKLEGNRYIHRAVTLPKVQPYESAEIAAVLDILRKYHATIYSLQYVPIVDEDAITLTLRIACLAKHWGILEEGLRYATTSPIQSMTRIDLEIK